MDLVGGLSMLLNWSFVFMALAGRAETETALIPAPSHAWPYLGLRSFHVAPTNGATSKRVGMSHAAPGESNSL